jgi:hypothetical protein
MTPATRTYAEEQADRCLDILVRWVQRAQLAGGPRCMTEAETFEFERVAQQVAFHAEREQLPLALIIASRAEQPVQHAVWEAFSNATPVTHHERGEWGSRDLAAHWLDQAYSVADRRWKHYAGVQ